jgi:hypothetical protein
MKVAAETRDANEVVPAVSTSTNPGQANTTKPGQGADVPVVAKGGVRKLGWR